MRPRVLFRTHYQIDEPAIIELLIKKCTSPVKSSYDESVAEKLAIEMRRRGKRLNEAAGKYALSLGQALGLVSENNVWSYKGHLLELTTQLLDGPWEQEVPLNPHEKLLHLRLFLEEDGAVFLYLSHYLLSHERIPNSDHDWNKIAQAMFGSIYTDYLRVAGTTVDRVALRNEIERLKREYRGKSGPHKMFIHLQTLYRVGLLERIDGGTRQYTVGRSEQYLAFKTLAREIKDVYTLENIIKARKCVELSSSILGIHTENHTPRIEHDGFLQLLIPIYIRVMKTGIPLCPLPTMIEAFQIDQTVSSNSILSYSDALQMLEALRKRYPREIRFHVDRTGAPAYVKLSDSIAKRQDAINNPRTANPSA